MGLLDGILGGVVGGEMVSVVNNLIERHGGVQGIVDQFQRQGLGATVQSWVGNGQNQSISPDQVHQAFDQDTLNAMAAKLGMSSQDLAGKLSAILPQAIDKLTPGGVVPSQ
ncbi:MAG: YidB family protein [Caldimonas sp.]|nr:YidB family protein [Pseudomonadota bacterium]